MNTTTNRVTLTSGGNSVTFRTHEGSKGIAHMANSLGETMTMTLGEAQSRVADLVRAGWTLSDVA